MGDLEQRVDECIKRVKERKQPTFPTAEKVKIGYTFKDWLYNGLIDNAGTINTRHYHARYGRKNHRPTCLIDAANGYLLNNEYDDGLLCLRDAMDMLGGKRVKFSLAMRFGRWVDDRGLAIGRFFNRSKLENYVLMAGLYAPDQPETSWYWSTLAKEIATEFDDPHKKEIYLFDALLATAQKRSDAQETWKETLAELRQEPVWERLGESRSLVRILKNNKFFAKTLVFKERYSLTAILREVEACKTLGEIVNEIDVPQLLHVTDVLEDNRYAHIMRYMDGETLYEKLKQEDKSAVPKVISALAKIHARFPIHQLSKISLEKRLNAKLYSTDFGIPQELAKIVEENYAPVIRGVTEDAVWVWNKDAHPENWIIGKKLKKKSDERIGVVDCEGTELVPATFDLANLLEYGDFFTQGEKKQYISQYEQEMEKEGKKLNHETIMCSYYNAVVHRMISLADAWSSPHREGMRPYRKQVLGRAVAAIDELAKEEISYHKQYQQQYSRLRGALVQIQDLIPT